MTMLVVFGAWALVIAGLLALGLVVLTVVEFVLDKLARRYGDEK